jgi:hypothetical protein
LSQTSPVSCASWLTPAPTSACSPTSWSHNAGNVLITIYSRSAQAMSSYQRSEDFSGNQPDPLTGFIGLHSRTRLIERPQWRATFPAVFWQQRNRQTPRPLAWPSQLHSTSPTALFMLYLKNQSFRAWQYIYVGVFSHTIQTTPHIYS